MLTVALGRHSFTYCKECVRNDKYVLLGLYDSLVNVLSIIDPYRNSAKNLIQNDGMDFLIIITQLFKTQYFKFCLLSIYCIIEQILTKDCFIAKSILSEIVALRQILSLLFVTFGHMVKDNLKCGLQCKFWTVCPT